MDVLGIMGFSSLSRRDFLVRMSAAAGVLACAPGAGAQGARFSRKVVIDAARDLATRPYTPLKAVPKGLLTMDYDEYQRIEYRKDAAIWGGTPTRFSVEMFAPGNLYTRGVKIAIVENGQAFAVPVDSTTFRLRGKALESRQELARNVEILDLLSSLGQVAGFRLHYPINKEGYQEEFVVFQGASYFRAVSHGQQYGLSARGLAIDVAEPTGEEFPEFREFWIERPSSRADSIVVHALLDSQRVSGAYRFGIYPDDPTRMDIEATLFVREELRHVGLGCLTSMYLFGELDRSDRPDYRRAVHDSVGLSMLTGQNESVWRPLNNPLDLQVSSFVDKSPKGFGLAQRDRTLESFEDIQVAYQDRPSAWVTPRGDWGEGHVVLVEIPTPSEANDNIVAYWRPQRPLQPHVPHSFAYQLSWPDDTPLPAKTGRVTRSAFGLKLGTSTPEMVIDYTGLPVEIDAEAMKQIVIDTSFSAATLVEVVIQPLGENGLRVFVAFDPNDARMSEIRIQPKYKGAALGETWLFRWLAR